MYTRLFVIGLAAFSAYGQSLQRQASIAGGGSGDRGKCTIEVVVDGAAEVEIRGTNATLRNLAGQPPQWRRFVCSGAMPGNPPNFRFTGVDGRGSQELVRAPQDGGVAVVRIQDPQNGSEGYTFDVTWGGGPNPGFPGRGDYPPPPPGPGGFGGRDRVRFTTDQAVRACQDTVRQQASDRFHDPNIAFRRTGIDDAPGRQDWVTGLFDMRRGYDRDETYHFSCSVNFETGEVRSAQIDPFDGPRMPRDGDAGPASNRAGMESCQRSVEDNIRQKGYQHVDFMSVNVDDRPGRNGWIVGSARADMRQRSDSFDFSCNVDGRDGSVRSVDVRAH